VWHVTYIKKGKAIPALALRVPGGLTLPEFLDNQHIKVVTLSAVLTGRLYPLGNIPDTHFG
jgi:hypothetical protein